ncbi:hypothetical protein LH47_01529 [Anoxybacillus thermarum]|uniref:Uncharacterized protein n=1 Tax=Anoxybacillus thermarum TaxID=404937 RepID=A0A0D0S0I7_9BACL|nr:hypothetical protein [Anoxybacillus thermarum]KIQ94411.1 hypothetical protein LH47_01529 [Anoxybacillus thermarum]
MKIVSCHGYELQKAQPNTSEDFFNRSEVTFVDDDGVERTLHVLYVRYFDERFFEWTPYEQDPVFQAGGKDVYFKDIVALVCLLVDPSLRTRKRVYISEEEELRRHFSSIDFAKLPEIFESLAKQQAYDVKSPLLFIAQP